MTLTADLLALLHDQRAALPNVGQALDLIGRAEKRAATLPALPAVSAVESDAWAALLADQRFEMVAAVEQAVDVERARSIIERAHETARRVIARARHSLDAAVQADSLALLVVAAKARRDGTATAVHEQIASGVRWPALAHQVAHQASPGDATLGGGSPPSYTSWWPLHWEATGASRQDFLAWQEWAWREFAAERFTIIETGALRFTERWTPPAVESGALDSKRRRGQPLVVVW